MSAFPCQCHCRQCPDQHTPDLTATHTKINKNNNDDDDYDDDNETTMVAIIINNNNNNNNRCILSLSQAYF